MKYSGYVITNDVARPLSYKTKTTFSRPRLLFKDHQIINSRLYTGVARNFDWERAHIGNIFVKLFW